METALEEIEFLALSANRVTVLERLAAEPQSRADLADATGASQATLGRILEDFEERSWIRRDGGTYTATPTGKLVSDGFTNLLTIVETEQSLRELVPYLPADALDFDLAHLADATIVQPTQTRPSAPLQRTLDLTTACSEIRSFSHAFNNQSLATVEQQVADGDLVFSGVFSNSAIDALTAESELCHLLRSLVEAEDAHVRVYDGEVPLAVTVADDVVHLLLRDDRGILQGSIDTDAEAVQSWAIDRFEAYWEASRPLEASDLSH
ncbi:helix-turn-helix transcriptional regulator [Haloarchaeobius amylolyticus]|uniref:helix-turn-helix transcriptional regulator n=1 Tax=Haloarchaeobius amylolyticus TaxID=1198296 RepID=UPI002271B08D|nr:helix-turn-helix domain-containing protein [Haloarchaeobius amylolyticus]